MDKKIKNDNYQRWSNYSKKRHRELLEYSQSLEQQGKSLNMESKKKYFELLDYSCLLSAQLDWETQNNYVTLLNQVVHEKISIGDFFVQFSKRSRINQDVFDILESKFIFLSPNEKALDFADLITEILEYYESLSNDSTFYDKRDELEMEILDSLKNFYLNLKVILNE
jgi:hypothetical protein